MQLIYFQDVGGLSLGLQEAGFNVLAAFDNWKVAVDTYRNNFNHPIFEADLSDEKNLK